MPQHESIDMRHAQPKQYFAATHRAVTSATAHTGAIGWEELPSLVDSLAQRLTRRRPMPTRANDSTFMNSCSFGSPWEATTPAALDVAAPSQRLHDPLAGLITGEVGEPGARHEFPGATHQA